jgi:hypothetical protein
MCLLGAGLAVWGRRKHFEQLHYCIVDKRVRTRSFRVFFFLANVFCQGTIILFLVARSDGPRTTKQFRIGCVGSVCAGRFFFFFYNKKQSGLGRNLWIAELQDVFAHWIHWFAVCLMVVCFSNQDKKKKELRFALIP